MTTPEKVVKMRLPTCSHAGAEDSTILEWTGGTDRAFEQQVYRPYLDQFMRAWNSYRMSITVGDPVKPALARPGPGKR